MPELEDLFHETGHCLQMLLSRTQYQHCAGVRGSFDIQELSSTFMENLAWDYRVLKQFAKKNGSVLPEELLRDQIEQNMRWE